MKRGSQTTSSPERKGEPTVLHGTATSPGIAIGRSYRYEKAAYHADEREITADEVKNELARLDDAVRLSERDLHKIAGVAHGQLGTESATVFEAQALMLHDPEFYDANHDSSIGVVVVAGAGRNFGAGGDVEWEKWGLRGAFYNRYPHNRLIRGSRKPVIAQVQGYCLGGHNHMAYCCDFTLAADTAIFGQAGPMVSSPADGFFVPYLTKVVGAKKAKDKKADEAEKKED